MKIAKLLYSFSKNELKNFEKFVKSPYFNTDQIVVKLYNELEKEIKKKTLPEDMSGIKIYNKLLNKNAVKSLDKEQDAYLRAKISILNQLIKAFFMIEALKENQVHHYMLLHEKLLKKKLFDMLKSSLKKEDKYLEGQKNRGIDYYFHKSQSEQTKLNVTYYQGRVGKEDNLSELMYNFDLYYLIKRHSFHLAAISFMEISGKKSFDNKTLHAISTLANLPQYADEPLLNTYRAAILTLESGEKSHFENLLELLKSELNIPKDNLTDFFKIAISFCARQLNEGISSYYKTSFDLYKTMDDKDLLIEKGIIPENNLKNIITISCRAHQVEWAIQTLNKYKSFIREEVREEVYHYNLGVIEFYQHNYSKAHDYFTMVYQSLNKINDIYNINVRIMILKCDYEIEETYQESSVAQWHASKKFIRTNESLSSKNKIAWQNFIYIASLLHQIKHKYTRTTLEQVKQKMEELGSNSIADKQWLLDKIKELQI